jgi:hypothetical protein
MLKERGKIKWQPASFLLEQTDSLRQLHKEYEYKTKPVLTQDMLEEINIIIQEGMEYNLTVNFIYFSDHDFRILVGNLHYIDEYKQEIRIMDIHNSLHKLKFTDIVDVRVN